MKVALLTFHNAANYGAALQAFALQRFLDSQGFDTEYIDYQNEARRQAYDMRFHLRTCILNRQWLSTLKFIVGMPFLQRRKSKFIPFYKKLHCTKKTYYNVAQLGEISDSFDKYVVGSDQVWNPNNNGRDIAFLLSFVKDPSKKISYSSSFGVSSIPEDLIEDYRRCLRDFAHLSCREEYGCRLIKDLTGRDATHVLDPVFLLDKERWGDCIGRDNKESFVFCYTNRESQLSDFLKSTHYPLEGSKIYKLTRYMKPADFLSSSVRVKYTMSPEEFLMNIRDAKMVVTASFHCLAMAIIFNKPFVCFVTGDKGKDERVVGLLNALGLTDRIYSSQMTLDDVNRPIDYNAVNKRKSALLKSSLDYLLSSLND